MPDDPSTLPILERIINDIETALKAVRTVGTAGSNQELEVLRNTQWEISPKDLTVVIHEYVEEPDKLDEENLRINWMHPIWIFCYVRDSKTSNVPLGRRLSILRSDIEKALTYGETSSTRGGLAVFTTILPPSPFEPVAGGFAGIAVRIGVNFWHQYNDPYNQ